MCIKMRENPSMCVREIEIERERERERDAEGRVCMFKFYEK